MDKNKPPMSVGIQISGTFDIALARQHLRKLSEELQWSPTLRLRAVAAFTAMAETAYFRDSQRQGPLLVYVHVLEPPHAKGIEFHADVDFESISRQFPVAKWHLQRVSDHLEIERRETFDHLVLRVLVNGKR